MGCIQFRAAARDIERDASLYSKQVQRLPLIQSLEAAMTGRKSSPNVVACMTAETNEGVSKAT